MHVVNNVMSTFSRLAFYINHSKQFFTQDSIKDALNKLCLHLPDNMNEECQDFVKTYTDELIEMLIADLNPEEVCVYLKLCSDSKPSREVPLYISNSIGGNVGMYYFILFNTINGIQLMLSIFFGYKLMF